MIPPNQQADDGYIPPLEVRITGTENRLPEVSRMAQERENRSTITATYEAEDIQVLDWGVKLSIEGQFYIIHEQHIYYMEYGKNPRKEDS